MRIVRVTVVWCTSCLLMKKRWKKAFEELKQFDILDYDFDEDLEEMEALQIGHILPVVIVYDVSGLEKERMIGEKSVKEIISTLGKYLK